MHTPTAARQKYFPQTSWALLSAARGEGNAATKALEEFSRRYYQPVYAYIAALTRNRDNAQELTQGFFTTVILSGRLLARLERSKGSFRPFLKQALRNYVADAWRKQKRHTPEEDVRPDGWSQGWDGLAQTDVPSPEAAFHTAWVRALLEEALAKVSDVCENKGQTEHLTLFLGRYVSEASEPPSWEELGKAYDLDGKAARNRAETVARHFRLVLREMLIDEVGSERSADAELATLLAFYERSL